MTRVWFFVLSIGLLTACYQSKMYRSYAPPREGGRYSTHDELWQVRTQIRKLEDKRTVLLRRAKIANSNAHRVQDRDFTQYRRFLEKRTRFADQARAINKQILQLRAKEQVLIEKGRKERLNYPPVEPDRRKPKKHR